jgi:hypothetical protein
VLRDILEAHLACYLFGFFVAFLSAFRKGTSTNHAWAQSGRRTQLDEAHYGDWDGVERRALSLLWCLCTPPYSRYIVVLVRLMSHMTLQRLSPLREVTYFRQLSAVVVMPMVLATF